MNLIDKIELELDTRDKRFMFFKLLFPDDLPFINLEGTPREVSSNILQRFKRNEAIDNLETALFSYFPSR